MSKITKIGLFTVASICSFSVCGGAYIFAGETFGEGRITHPTGYTGAGGQLSISVCIDPTSSLTSELVQPVKNVVGVWNQLDGINDNLKLFGENNIPSISEYDWESVVLHEVGHCIGLAHPNLGSQTGVSGDDTNYTNTTDGVDNVFAFGSGVDGVIGSSDDVRGDDVNLFWFNDGVNNPFVASPPYDETNYTRNVAGNLPGVQLFPANPDRAVAFAMGFGSRTEAVMQQGTFNDEDQRRIGIDDEATIRYGMTGLDEEAGTADDYTYVLTYGGIASGCDINIKHDPTYMGFARCGVSGSFLNGTHVTITAADIQVNPSAVTWFFNTEANDLIFEDGFE